MDPVTVIAGISAFLEAANTWIKYKDSARAAEAFRIERTNAPKRLEIINDAKQISDVIPDKVLEALWSRSRVCWDHYLDVLEAPRDHYTPKEIDDATLATNKCVCRELRRVINIIGSLPPGKMQEAWNTAGCS